MSEKHIAARRRYWDSLTKEQRSARMRTLATNRQKKMTFAQRRAHSLKMIAARNAKFKKPTNVV